jgi:hypothetical protein
VRQAAFTVISLAVLVTVGFFALRQPNKAESVTKLAVTQTYDSAISYTLTRPSFTPKRTVSVATSSAFKTAITNLQAGDLVKATASFTVIGETIISKRLSAAAVIDLTGHAVKFVYSGGSNLPAVWLKNPSNIRIYGGDLSTADTGGSCLINYGSQHVLWWGFTAHDCGGSGAGFAGNNYGPTENNDFQGTLWKVGQHPAWDNHTEKGSGIHCINLDDHNVYAFQDNRFAFYCHDIPTGAAIEYGASQTAYPKPIRNTIILKAVNLTFVSKIQTGGNAIQFWGVNGQSATIKYLEVTNAQGYGLFDGGMYSGATLSGVTVQYGRATNTNLNPRYAGKNPWQTDKGVVYQDVLPTP